MLFRISFKWIFFASLASMLTSCDNPSLCSNDEILRKSSPDKVVDAVIVKKNCGATTSSSYSIFIVPSESEVFDQHVFLSDKTDNLKITWATNKQLSIVYNKARIFEYTNFWQSSKIENFKYIVEISESKLGAKR